MAAAGDQPRDGLGRFIRDADAGVKGMDQLASRAAAALVSLKSLDSGALSVAGSLAGMAGGGGVAAGVLSSLLPIIGAVTLALSALTAIASGVGFGVKLAAEAEQTQVAFETMLGSADKARSLIGDIRSFAIETPFREDELVSAGRKLLAFGEEAQDVVTVMRRLGDVSSGSGAPLNDLAEIYGKARVQGRLFAQDINQLSGRGIPIQAELAKAMGYSAEETGKLMKAVERGQVSFAHLEQAVITLTAAGTDWGGLTAKQSETVLGKWSTLQDTITGALRSIGERFLSTGIAQEAMSQGSRLAGAAFQFVEQILDKTGPTIAQVAQNVLALTGQLVAFTEWITGVKAPTEEANKQIAEQEIRATAASAAMERQAKAAEALADVQGQYATRSEKLAETLKKISELDAAGDTIANLSRRAMLQETGLGSELDRLRTEIDILEGRTTSIQAKANQFRKDGADEGHVRRFTDLSEQAEALKAAQKAAEERAKVMEREEERTRKLGEQLKQQEKDRAKEIFDSTRNPAEQLRAGLREIVELRQKGLIDQETFSRQAKQLGEEFRNAMPKAQEWQPNVAVEARTSEALSIAIAATSRKATDPTEEILGRLLKESQDQLAESERQTAILDQRLRIYETGSAF